MDNKKNKTNILQYIASIVNIILYIVFIFYPNMALIVISLLSLSFIKNKKIILLFIFISTFLFILRFKQSIKKTVQMFKFVGNGLNIGFLKNLTLGKFQQEDIDKEGEYKKRVVIEMSNINKLEDFEKEVEQIEDDNLKTAMKVNIENIKKIDEIIENNEKIEKLETIESKMNKDIYMLFYSDDDFPSLDYALDYFFIQKSVINEKDYIIFNNQYYMYREKQFIKVDKPENILVDAYLKNIDERISLIYIVHNEKDYANGRIGKIVTKRIPNFIVSFSFYIGSQTMLYTVDLYETPLNATKYKVHVVKIIDEKYFENH
ncbi:hypothetical protein SLOPH_2230 [Spraguea lophii 42_110]|uniref:Uncharacterized protein n=1 Tax=Spraguea lophii (strain 42_110) TaxID=1358809 RepID=S7WAF6_SPRLO|nr:hypothetical protein SLOPH_2230 [Spraguea lophii 42_110]